MSEQHDRVAIVVVELTTARDEDIANPIGLTGIRNDANLPIPKRRISDNAAV
jgi:hypothetical protein